MAITAAPRARAAAAARTRSGQPPECEVTISTSAGAATAANCKYRRRIGQRRAGNAEPEELVTGIARHVPGRPKSREHQLSRAGQGVERGAIGMADKSARRRNSD